MNPSDPLSKWFTPVAITTSFSSKHHTLWADVFTLIELHSQCSKQPLAEVKTFGARITQPRLPAPSAILCCRTLCLWSSTVRTGSPPSHSHNSLEELLSSCCRASVPASLLWTQNSSINRRVCHCNSLPLRCPVPACLPLFCSSRCWAVPSIQHCEQWLIWIRMLIRNEWTAQRALSQG